MTRTRRRCASETSSRKFSLPTCGTSLVECISGSRPKDLAIFYPDHELKCAICDGLSYFICVRTSFSLAATRQGPFPTSELVPRSRLSQDGLKRQTTFTAASANQRPRSHDAHE
ncbi:unnamed protein product, partial [Ectocarpus sp. 6 AP-2014]